MLFQISFSVKLLHFIMNKNNTNAREMFKHFFINFEDFTLEQLKNKIVENMSVNTSYSIIIKLCSVEEQIFKMVGRQVGFVLTESNIELLYDTVVSRVDMYSELYGIEQNIRSIDFMYKIVTPDNKLSLQNINNIKFDKTLIKIKETKHNFSFRLLPLSTNTEFYGRVLFKTERKD